MIYQDSSMLLSDILTVLAPILSIIVYYLMDYYVNIRSSRNTILDMISEASSTLRKFETILNGTLNTKQGLTIAIANIIVLYAAILLIFTYLTNPIIYAIPTIPLFAAYIQFILAKRYVNKKEKQLLAIDLKKYGSIQAILTIISWLMIILQNSINVYITSPQDVPSYILSAGFIALMFSVLTIYLTQILKQEELENSIFISRFANKMLVEVVTPRINYSGKIIGVGRFLNIKNGKKTQIIKWHDIKEIAVIKE